MDESLKIIILKKAAQEDEVKYKKLEITKINKSKQMQSASGKKKAMK